MSNNINSASGALFGITTIVTNKKNPGNIESFPNGPQGRRQQNRIPTNLGRSGRTTICSFNDNSVSNNSPQKTVTNTSSILRKRANSCTSGSSSLNCGVTNFKIQNPLNHTISAYIGKNTTSSRICEINPNSAYENFSNNCYTKIVNGVPIQVACSKPIVKTTETPSTSTFLRTQYFKNNCLPMPSTGNKAISSIKIMQNKNCGTSNGC